MALGGPEMLSDARREHKFFKIFKISPDPPSGLLLQRGTVSGFAGHTLCPPTFQNVPTALHTTHKQVVSFRGDGAYVRVSATESSQNQSNATVAPSSRPHRRSPIRLLDREPNLPPDRARLKLRRER